MMRFNVKFTNFVGQRSEAGVTVYEGSDEFGPYFYAQKLELFGCDKNALSPVGAVHLLMQDHGQVIAVKRIDLERDYE